MNGAMDESVQLNINQIAGGSYVHKEEELQISPNCMSEKVHPGSKINSPA